MLIHLHTCRYCTALPLQGPQDLSASLVNHLQNKVASTHVDGTCSATAQEKEDAAHVVQRLSNDQAAGPKVLVVCGDAAGSLEDELQSVAAFSKAVQAAFGSHVMAYVSDTSSQVCNCLEPLLCTQNPLSQSFGIERRLSGADAVRLAALLHCNIDV